MTARRWTILIVPMVLLYILAFLFSQAIFLSDSLYAPAGPAVLGAGPSLANYWNLLTDPYYLNAFEKSLLVSAAVAAIGLVFAFPMAFFIAQTRSRLGFVLLIVVVGMLFSNAVIRSLGWRILLSTVGPLNGALVWLGLEPAPVRFLDNYDGALIGLVHALLPIYVVSLIPVCQAVPRNLIRASAGLGASGWQTFWRVIFPLTKNGIVASALLIFANSIGSFTTPLLLGGGRLLLLPILIREKILLELEWPIGAALAAMLVALVLAISVLVAWLNAGRARAIPQTGDEAA